MKRRMNNFRSWTLPVPSPKIIFTIILSFCFFLQVRNNVSKFLRRQTTTAMSREVQPEGVKPPVLSFCPGHNRDWDNYEEMYSMLANENGRAILLHLFVITDVFGVVAAAVAVVIPDNVLS